MKAQRSADSRKRSGAHYTPAELGAFLAESILRHVRLEGKTLRVLDPACGDGGLLLAFIRALPHSLRGKVVLTGFDTDPAAAALATEKLGRLGVRETEVVCKDFLSVLPSFGEEGYSQTLFEPGVSGRAAFDVVIANPPYVRTQVLGSARSRELARKFGLTGRVDLYHAFVRGISRVLAPGGIVGLITSNRFLSISSGGAMRRLLREELTIKAVFDLGDTKLFDAAVLPAILVAGKEERPPKTAASFTRIYERRRGGASRRGASPCGSPLDALRAGREGVVETAAGRFEIESGRLGVPPEMEGPWFLSTPRTDSWLRRIEAFTEARFGDVAEIRVGIKTTADSAFIRSDWDTLPPARRPEGALLRPLIVHQDARRWRAESERPEGSKVLYPHIVREGKRSVVDLNEYPRARAYLETYHDRLAARKYIREAGRRWYEIWVPHDPRSWRHAKVVFPDISEAPKFFLDETGAVVNGDCYWITLRDGADPRWLRLILAVANSTLATDYYDARFHNKLYSGKRRFITQYVRKFPLPSLDSQESRKLVEKVDELVANRLSDARLKELESGVDDWVQRAFGLPEEVRR